MSDERVLFPARQAGSLHQPTLFRSSAEEFVAEVMVSEDEMRRWHTAGWLSFDPETIKVYDEAEGIEVLFIRALVRFGLSDAMIQRLLADLERPYCYDLRGTFYCFHRQGWVTVAPAPEREDLVADEIETLIQGEQWNELQEIRDRLEEALKDHESDDH